MPLTAIARVSLPHAMTIARCVEPILLLICACATATGCSEHLAQTCANVDAESGYKQPCHSKRIRQQYLGCSSYEALCQRHHVSVVSISLIQLNRSELWVVAGADALITEDTSNLKHPLKSTDNHALEM